MNQGWIGVDLDGTLAQYDGWVSAAHVGAPVTAMVERVKRWIDAGHEVRIFTARMFPFTQVIEPGVTIEFHRTPSERQAQARDAIVAIQTWCELHIGRQLPITCVKDYGMIELWDDRAVQVLPNTGEPVGKSTRGLS